MKKTSPKRQPPPCLPNLIIIGAMKCATSSLHYYLGLHPEIWMSREKEINFFSFDDHWRRGRNWYRTHFRNGYTINGEASPSYTWYPRRPHAPSRMHALIPEARLIYLVRDPLARIVSHYLHACSVGNEQRPLEEALDDLRDNFYLYPSFYHLQLERYLRFYHPERVLVVQAETLRDRRAETLRRIFRFLGVCEDFSSPRFSVMLHRSSDKRRQNRVGRLLKTVAESPFGRPFPTHWRMKLGRYFYRPFSAPMAPPALSAELRRRLAAHIGPDVARLRAATGLPLDGWPV